MYYKLKAFPLSQFASRKLNHCHHLRLANEKNYPDCETQSLTMSLATQASFLLFAMM